MTQKRPSTHTVLVYLDPSLPTVEKPPIKKLVGAFLRSAKYEFGTYQVKLRRWTRCETCHPENTILIKDGEYLQVLGVEVRLRGENRIFHGQIKLPSSIIKRPIPTELNVSAVGVVAKTPDSNLVTIASDEVLDSITGFESNCRLTIREMQALYQLPKRSRPLSDKQIHRSIAELQALLHFAEQARATRIAQIKKKG